MATSRLDTGTFTASDIQTMARFADIPVDRVRRLTECAVLIAKLDRREAAAATPSLAAEVAYEMKVFLHGAKSAPPVAPGWLAQIEKWRARLDEGSASPINWSEPQHPDYGEECVQCGMFMSNPPDPCPATGNRQPCKSATPDEGKGEPR